MFPKDPLPIDYAARRKLFLNRIKGSVAVFPAAPLLIRNHDVTYPYRQDSAFYYLSGFAEPNSFILLDPQSDTPYQIFVPPRDKTKELWEGHILGPERAKDLLQADAAHPSEPPTAFENALVQALVGAESLYYRVGQNPERDQWIFRLMSAALRKVGRSGRSLWPIRDPGEILGEMRLVKTRSEIDRLQVAANISAEAHVNAMRITKPGMFEFEVEAVLYHAFRAHGAGRVGYESIVASGPNACTLHYVENNRKMDDKDLVLIDAGAEFDYYTADITRVFPAGGKFSEEQREVYLSVLRVQKECIEMARPGVTLTSIHNHAVEGLTEELKRLKVLKGPTARLIKSGAYRAYYPHGTSHWLGMDVHDAGRYYGDKRAEPRKLQPGMVFTVEPGLYFSPESDAPDRYKGVGIRIEDDVLMTSGGCKVLTSGVPKEADEVESMCHS